MKNVQIIKNSCLVVLLPTIEKSLVHLSESGILFQSAIPTTKSNLYKSTPQHLYILSDDEIKKGDYVLSLLTNSISKVEKDNIKNLSVNKTYFKKIIATNNKSLVIQPKGIGTLFYNFPQPSKYFIKNYIDEHNNGNIINNVNVNYKPKFALDGHTIVGSIPIIDSNGDIFIDYQTEDSFNHKIINKFDEESFLSHISNLSEEDRYSMIRILSESFKLNFEFKNPEICIINNTLSKDIIS